MPRVSKSSVTKTMKEIFTDAQHSKSKHQKLMKKLRKLYESSNEEEFTNSFCNCLKVPLSILDNHPVVQNTIHFAANFASSLFPSDGGDDDDETEPESLCQFLIELIDFLDKSLNSIDVAVRFRVCHFLNLFLNSMGENATLDDELIEKLCLSLTNRLMDKVPKVRTQATYALHRLQDPMNEKCPVIRLYLFHLAKDPSAEVRKAIISSIGRNGKALQAILRRIRDVNDGVRKTAYLFISKVLMRSLTIKCRETILREGLKDKLEAVRRIVRETLLPGWLQQANNNFIELLRALDAEITSETICMVLPILFDRTERKILIEEIPLDPDTKLIPIDQLTSENVLYWRCLVEYFYKKECTELVEECLPELTKLCDYIRSYQEKMSTGEYSNTEKRSQKFIFGQLFELSKSYDLSDEAGRANLKQVILDILMNDNCSGKTIESIVKYSEIVIPNVSTRLSCLAHVISEIRMPIKQSNVEIEQMTDDEQHERQMQIQRLRMSLIGLSDKIYELIQKKDFREAQILQEQIEKIENRIKELAINPVIEQNEESYEEKNDPDTMLKCLQIMCGMAEAHSVKTLTSILRSLFDNMVFPSIAHSDNAVQTLALKAVGICLLLDKELAKKHWMIYILQFAEEDREIWVIALKVIFDLFLLYGLDYFNVVPDDDDNTTQDESRRNRTGRTLYSSTEDITGISTVSESGHNNNIVKIMLPLLEHGDQDIRTLTTQGFCKLLLHGKLSSDLLVSRLIILFHNPVTDDDVELRHCLLTFFKTYIRSGHHSHEVLARAFMLTLQTVDNAPDESPLQAIDPLHVSNFILSLIDSKIQKPEVRNYSVHNDLAFSILAEVLTPKYHIERDILLKSLKFLNVYFDKEESKRDIKEALNKIAETVSEKDRSLKACLTQFLHKIERQITQDTEEQPQQQPPQQEESENELIDQDNDSDHSQ